MTRTPSAARTVRRPDRLPAPVRRAVRAVEAAYVSGTDAEYAAALAQLQDACAGLDDRHRLRLEEVLAQARDRAERVTHLAVLGRALAGPWTTVATLPGDVELVALQGPEEGQLLVTAPTTRPEDGPDVLAAVAGARAALAAARCTRCAGELDYRADGAVFLAHARRCPFTEQRIAAARARARC